MQQAAQQSASRSPVDTPIVCPVCWDHAVERVEGIKLSANNADGRNVGGANIFRCGQWHLFAVFERP
jgi:hypothetical protein